MKRRKTLKAQEPLRFTSLFYDFTTGQRSVTHWTAGDDASAPTPTATCEDCGAPIAAGTRFCPASDGAACSERTFVRSGGAALCERAAAARMIMKSKELD